MKKLLKFLSLTLASVSLLLPSASALRDVAVSDSEKFRDCEFASSYAEEAYRDYEKLKSEKNLNELMNLKRSIAYTLRMLVEKDPQLGVCLTVQLIKFFGPRGYAVNPAEGDKDKYNPDVYDKECCIVSAPTLTFRDLPIIVQLFHEGYVSNHLRIN